MNTATRATVLVCSRCDGVFDGSWQPIDMGDRLSSEVNVYGGICPPCSLTASRERRTRSLPAALRNLTFAELDRTEDRAPALDAAERWGRSELQGLVLFGSVGTGKTRAAATAANQRIEHEPLTWLSVPALLAKALSAIDSEDRREAVAALTGTGTLVLDDLDKAKPSEWALSQLFLAIDQRVNAGAGLLVTTNRSMRAIVETLGEPIASRLQGYCEVCHMGGSDRRLG